MINLTGKCGVVTGGSRGIGRATALALARCGCSVAITYNASERAADEVCELASEHGVRTSKHRANLAKLPQIDAVVNEVLEQHEGVDILVNNAGISEIKSPEEITPELWDRMFDLNLRGLFFLTQRLTAHMTERGAGSVVNVASTAGVVGGYFIGAHYAATKAGVISLTKSLAKAGAKGGIRVNCVAPGLIETDMMADYPDDKVGGLVENIPLGRLGTASEVADSIVFLSSHAASYITGVTLLVNGGVHM